MQSVVVQLTREQLEAKRVEAAAKGFVLAGDAGEIEVKGVKPEVRLRIRSATFDHRY